MTVQQWCRLLFGLGGELLVLIYAPCLLIWSIMIGLKVCFLLLVTICIFFHKHSWWIFLQHHLCMCIDTFVLIKKHVLFFYYFQQYFLCNMLGSHQLFSSVCKIRQFVSKPPITFPEIGFCQYSCCFLFIFSFEYNL